MAKTCPNCTVSVSEASATISLHSNAGFLLLMSVFIVVALLGNSIVLCLMGRSGGWRKPVSIFIMSLAFGDILIALFSMTTEVIWEDIGTWRYGNVACKALTYIQCLLFGSTSFLLMSMNFDRYEAICKPMRLSRSLARSRRMVAFSWIAAAVIAVPHIFIFLLVDVGANADGSRRYACRSQGYTAPWQRKLYVTWLGVYVFLIPLIFMGFCGMRIVLWLWRQSAPGTARSTSSKLYQVQLRRNVQEQSRALTHAKIRTIQLTLSILFCYILCWTPYFTVTLFNVWTDYTKGNQIPAAVSILSQGGAWFSSCVNPFIYGLFHLSVEKVRAACCYEQPKLVIGSTAIGISSAAGRRLSVSPSSIKHAGSTTPLLPQKNRTCSFNLPVPQAYCTYDERRKMRSNSML